MQAMRAALFATAVGLAGCGDYVLVPEGSAFQAPSDLVTGDLSQVAMLRYYALGGLLAEHVVVDGASTAVRYDDLLADDEGLGVATFTLEQLGGVDPLTLAGPDDRLAFFMNLYNVGVLTGVLAELQADPDYDSVSAGSFLFFGVPRVSLGGHAWTLDQLEHGIVRGHVSFLEGLEDEPRALAAAWHDALWSGGPVDARLHVGVNCSARSCPNLLQEPFRGDTVHAQLDAAAATFVNDPTKGAGPDGISELFTWFEDDFVGSHGSVQGFVETYRTTGLRTVDFDTRIPYDWSLNRF